MFKSEAVKESDKLALPSNDDAKSDQKKKTQFTIRGQISSLQRAVRNTLLTKKKRPVFRTSSSVVETKDDLDVGDPSSPTPYAAASH